MVCRSMPPALSAPSLSITMAPSGSEEDSARTRSSVSPMRVAGSVALSRPVEGMRSGSLPKWYRRTWKRSPSDFSRPLSRTALAASSREPPESLRAMLFESSTRTATTFCWGRRVATLSAGCQSRNRITAIMPVSSSQMAMGRNPLSMPWLRRTCQKRSAAATRMATAMSQRGQGVRKTNWPLWKMLAGYLNRSSNMSAYEVAIRVWTCEP